VTTTEPIATLLFVPGSRRERFAKALASGADAVCIDLEDAVPETGKADARAAALAALREHGIRLSVRMNALKTRLGLTDLLALSEAEARPALVLVPKVESAAEVEVVHAALGAASGIVPLIESVKGLDAARDIAAAPGVAALIFGGGDLSAELGVELAWEPLRTARGLFVLACAAAGIQALDVPFLGLDDTAGLIAETRAAKALGFTGKTAIHPAQVAPMRSVFDPSAAELAEAQDAERAFAAAGGAAVRFKGRVLDVPIMRRYQRVLAIRSKRDA
jgi:citrate lyase beta subunit